MNDIVEAAIEPEFMRLNPIQLLTFLGCKMKLDQLIFWNRKLDCLFDFFANKVVFELHKREKTHELVAQKGYKTKKNKFSHLQI